jgi:large subunit ribosomal protein L29
MKAKVWQETKAMSVAELESKLREAKEQLFRMKFRHSSTPLKNGLIIRDLRRSVARYKTLLKEKAAVASK